MAKEIDPEAPKIPSTDQTKWEYFAISRLSPDDDIASYLCSHGIQARNQHGPINAAIDITEWMAKVPSMYVYAMAAAPVLIAALKAYAATKQKRLIIRRLGKGIEIDLNNYTVDEIKDLSALDLFDFKDDKPQKK